MDVMKLQTILLLGWYHTAGKLGWGKFGEMTFGKRKLGKLINQPIGY